MKKLYLILITIFSLSFFLNAQNFQNSFPDVNDEIPGNNSNQQYFDLKNPNTLKSANGLVSLIDSFEAYSFNTELVWEGTFKVLYTYDDRGNVVRYLEKDWNEDAGDFLIAYDSHLLYDDNNNEIEYLSLEWNDLTLAWDTFQIKQSLYDENGNLTEDLFTRWDPTLSEWVSRTKVSYIYDENGNQIEVLTETRESNGSAWNNFSLVTSEFNLDGFMTIQIKSVPGTVDGIFTWKNSTKSIYSYDDDGFLYSDNGILLILESQKWDATNQIWLKNYYYQYRYVNELLNVRTLNRYNASEETYSEESNIYYNYDEFGNLKERLHKTFDASTSTWIETSKYKWYYSQHEVTAAKTLELNQTVIIYPNPAENEISLSNITEASTVSIHDINGKLFIQREVNSNKEVINVSKLPVGLYFMKISNRSGQQVAKLVKK